MGSTALGYFLISVYFSLINGEIMYADLSYKYEENTTYFYWADQYMKWHPDQFNGPRSLPDGTKYTYAGFSFFMGEHGGTHMDAPSHFWKDGWTVDEIPLKRMLNRPLCVVDIREKVKSNHDYAATQSDFEAWENEYGRIPEGGVVFIKSGWSSRYPDRKQFFGMEEGEPGKDRTNWNEERKSYHFPGFSAEGALWLVKERKVFGVGTDGPTLDYGQSPGAAAHVVFLQNNVWGLEALAPLDALPEQGALVNVLPIKLKGGSGGASRVYATWDTTGGGNTLNKCSVLMIILIFCIAYYV